jgi:pimeloyl-ACP methyl ester carboxylesterase
MRKFAKLLVWLLMIIVLSIGLYALWCAVAYRDIDTAELLEDYGEGVQFAEVGGTTLAYRVDGDLNDSPPWVLLHSHYFDSLMWEGVLAELGTQAPVIRYDLTSHGLSGPDTNADYSMARDVELLAGLLDSLGVDSAFVVGSSLGGNIAFNFAAAYPERTEGLVLINSGGMKRQQSSRRNASGIAPWFYRVFYFVPTTAYRAFIQWMVADEAVVSDTLVQRFHRMFRHRGNRQAEMQRMASFDSGEPAQVLTKVTAPTFIVWGKQNPQLPVELAEEFISLLGNAHSVEKVIVDGAGHLLPFEKPAETATLLNIFRSGL